MAALKRMSFSLSLRASINAGTIWATSSWRSGKRRTAISRLRSCGPFKSSSNSAVVFVLLQPPVANRHNNRTKPVPTRIAHILRLASGQQSLASPIVHQRFAAGNGAEGLISVGVDAAGEEMHRAIAEQKIRSDSVCML